MSDQIESIYNLLPKPEFKAPKQPMYHSRHDPLKPVTGSTFGCTGSSRVVGAGSGDHINKAKKKDEKTASDNVRKAELRKPTVPKRDENPLMGLKTNKDFVTANAVEAILAPAKDVKKKDVDWKKKTEYGKVPGYLGKVKEEIKRENDMIDAFVKAQLGQEEEQEESTAVLGDDEKNELITALKMKWDATNARYQKICHQTVLDTVGKVKRKEALEAELDQLEKDIQALELSKTVVIKG